MANKPNPSYLNDEPQPRLGEGLSRTSSSTAKLWRVDVQIANSKPMKTTILATSRKQAAVFTKNRYPTATTITVIGKANAKTN